MRRNRSGTYIQLLERRTAFWLATFTAFAGAALGGGADVVAGDSAKREFTIRLWVSAALIAIALTAGAFAWSAWRKRNRLRRERGTAYVVDSPARGWTSEEKDAFLNGARTEMASVVTVPGPTGMTSWGWPLGPGAERWSDAVDDLVLSFRSVWANDDRSTTDCVVCWAPHPVAIAWTARAYAAERGLTLRFRQRPTRGRAGRIDVPDWNQGVLSFDSRVVAPAVGYTCALRIAHLRVGEDAGVGGRGDHPKPRVLLIRLHGGDWAGVPLDEETPVNLRIENGTGEALRLGSEADFHEWRYLLGPGQMHPWSDYPLLVSQICDWIAETAHPTGTNLIGMLVPQEIGLGIGINVSRRTESEWPRHLWPLVKFSREQPLTIPGLDLGFDSLHREYRYGPL